MTKFPLCRRLYYLKLNKYKHVSVHFFEYAQSVNCVLLETLSFTALELSASSARSPQLRLGGMQRGGGFGHALPAAWKCPCSASLWSVGLLDRGEPGSSRSHVGGRGPRSSFGDTLETSFTFTKKCLRGTWLALLVEYVTLDLGVESSSPTYGIEFTF